LFARSASKPINAWLAQAGFSIAGVCNNNSPHNYWPKPLTKPAVFVSHACNKRSNKQKPQLQLQSKQYSFLYQIKSMSLPKQSQRQISDHRRFRSPKLPLISIRWSQTL
jgi:hypothetical protein